MKAIVLDGINLPLTVKKVDVPVLKEGEALVKINAAALNRRDFWIQKGQYAGLRFPIILGSDGAGIVEQVGTASDENWLGKDVIVNPSLAWGDDEINPTESFSILGLPQDGTLAEYAKVPVENLYEMPDHLTYEEAAAIPLGGLTAWRALFTKGQLQAGERVLIGGVGGGVATLALQWALNSGAEVYVTSGSRKKIKRAVELGAKGGILYTEKDWSKKLKSKAGGFNVIIDSALGSGFSSYIDLAEPGARIVFFGGTADGKLPELDGRKIFWKQLSILGTKMGSPKEFRDMLNFIVRNQVKPVIDSVLPMAHAEEAIRKMDLSEQFGKIVLKVF